MKTLVLLTALLLAAAACASVKAHHDTPPLEFSVRAYDSNESCFLEWEEVLAAREDTWVHGTITVAQLNEVHLAHFRQTDVCELPLPEPAPTPSPEPGPTPAPTHNPRSPSPTQCPPDKILTHPSPQPDGPTMCVVYDGCTDLVVRAYPVRQLPNGQWAGCD